MHLIIFEDSYYMNLLPLTYLRAAFELRLGASSLLEKITGWWNKRGEVFLLTRDYLTEVIEKRYPEFNVNIGKLGLDEELLLVNGTLLLDSETIHRIESLAKNRQPLALTTNNRIAAAYLPRKSLTRLEYSRLIDLNHLKNAVRVDAAHKFRFLTNLWEIPKLNRRLLERELPEMVSQRGEGDIDPHAVIYGDRVYVGEGSEVEAGVVIDSRSGPVYVGRDCRVEAHSRISGPAYVGDGSILFSALIREGCSIGRVCRIGGEVEESVLHGYVNKRHYGFLGHSYLAEWVNLGAGTTNSNLKNTYGTIRMSVGGRRVDTGEIFLGCFIADHVKTSIGTLIYGGRRVGVASHLYGIVREDVPSFTHYAESLGQGKIELHLESVLKTARRVMNRRGVSLSPEEERLMEYVYKLTGKERLEAKVSGGRIR